MSEREGSPSPLFLDDKSIEEVLEQATKSLLISPSEEIIEEAFNLIKSMKEDLIRLSHLSLDNVEPFKSHDSLTLEEIDNFYKGEGKDLSTPHAGDLIQLAHVLLNSIEPLAPFGSLALEAINFSKKQVSKEKGKCFLTPHTIN